MKKNVAIIPIKDYNDLKRFKVEMENDQVYVVTNNHYNANYYMSMLDFDQETIDALNVQTKMVNELKEKNLDLRNAQKLNFMQRLFNW